MSAPRAAHSSEISNRVIMKTASTTISDSTVCMVTFVYPWAMQLYIYCYPLATQLYIYCYPWATHLYIYCYPWATQLYIYCYPSICLLVGERL